MKKKKLSSGYQKTKMMNKRIAEEKFWGGKDMIPKDDACGVYKITNMITSEFYIGASIEIRKRIRCHRSKGNSSSCYFLRANMKKYKLENFKGEVLELCDKQVLREREVFYIKVLKPALNITVFGSRKIRPYKISLCTNKKQRANFINNQNITMRICSGCKNPCLNKTGEAANLEEKDCKQITLTDFIMEGK